MRNFGNEKLLFFLVGFWVSDPDVRTLDTERSMMNWQENAVIVCLAFPGAVYELGVSPSGKTEPLTLVWKDAYSRGGHYDVPEFNLARLQPFVLGEVSKRVGPPTLRLEEA